MLAAIDWNPMTIAGLALAGVVVLGGVWALILSLLFGQVRRPPRTAAYRSFARAHRPGDVVPGRITRIDAGRACVVLARYVVAFAPAPPGARPGDVIDVTIWGVDSRARRVHTRQPAA